MNGFVDILRLSLSGILIKRDTGEPPGHRDRGAKFRGVLVPDPYVPRDHVAGHTES